MESWREKKQKIKNADVLDGGINGQERKLSFESMYRIWEEKKEVVYCCIRGMWKRERERERENADVLDGESTVKKERLSFERVCIGFGRRKRR